MSHSSETDSSLLDDIRAGKADAWARLVRRYEGRLLNFAASRLPQRADAEDIVQDTLVAFIKALDSFRDAASLETYLFAILRNRIIDRYRSKRARSVCLIQDIYSAEQGEHQIDAFEQMAGADPTASWCLSRDEQNELGRQALTQVLVKMLNRLKESLKFRDLKMVELLLYCNISSADTARLLKLEKTTVRVFKHRCLKRIRENVTKLDPSANLPSADFENALTEIWEAQRLSCPKRSTLGTFLLETLEPGWFEYVDFHLTTIGCHFCRANLKDLKQQKTTDKQRLFRERIMASTIGFLSNP